MEILGFVTGLASATIKVVVTPLAIVKDVVEGEPLETTSDLLESAKDDIEEAFDDLLG